jgi:hypothetical protein
MDPEEYKIWKTAKAQGKSDAFIKGAIVAYRQNSGASKAPASSTAQQTNLSTPAKSALGGIFDNFSEGVAKGEASTVKSLGSIGQKFLDQTAGRVVNAVQGKGFTPTNSGLGDIYRKGSEASNQADAALAPQGAAQNIGFYGEKAAEFAAPASIVNKGHAAINTLIDGSGFLSAAGRVASKAALEGGSAGAVNYGQTADTKQAATTAATAGAFKAGTGSLGEAVKAINLPERLYSTIFKNSFQDMQQELKTVGTRAFEKADPARYNELVSKGIIKVGKDGKAVLDETLAKEALDQGLKGSLSNMANAVVRNKYELEDKVQTLAAHSRDTIAVPETQFESVFNKIASDYQDVGFGEFSSQAKRLADTLATQKEFTVSDALDARRLLDSLRIRSSFGTAPTHLSLGQDNLKFLANQLRARLNNVDGMGEIMKDYSFNIDALEALAKEAARRGNNQVISLIDSILLGGGVQAANPVPSSLLFTAKKILQNPRAITNAAQAIQNSGSLSKTGAALKGTAASATAQALNPSDR